MRIKSILVLLCLLTLAACGEAAITDGGPAAQPEAVASTSGATAESNPPSATAPTAAPTAAPAAPAGNGDARTAVVAALSAQAGGGPYRITSVVESDGTAMQMMTEAVPPDRYRATSTMDGGAATEMVIIGDTIWTKAGDQWVARPSQGTAAAVRGQNTPEEIDAMISEASLVGEERVDGVPALAYTYTVILGEGDAAIASTATLWVAVDSGLPIKTRGTADLGAGTTTTTSMIVYDASITIEAPQ